MDEPGSDVIPFPVRGTPPKSRAPRFQRFRALDCFEEAHQMLLDGLPPQHVADFIQEECQEYTDVTRESLGVILCGYRGELPLEDKVPVLPQHLQRSIAKARKGLHELNEMEDLYRLQRARVDIDAELERNINKLLPTTAQEVRVALDILDKSARIKLDLGIAKAVYGGKEESDPIENLTARVEDDGVRKVLENPESRLRLMGLADKLVSLAGEKKIDGIIDAEYSDAKGPPSPEEVDPLSEDVDG
jgi:hypothetical protein